MGQTSYWPPPPMCEMAPIVNTVPQILASQCQMKFSRRNSDKHCVRTIEPKQMSWYIGQSQMSQDKHENDKLGIPDILAQRCQWPVVRGEKTICKPWEVKLWALTLNEWDVGSKKRLRSRPMNRPPKGCVFVWFQVKCLQILFNLSRTTWILLLVT